MTHRRVFKVETIIDLSNFSNRQVYGKYLANRDAFNPSLWFLVCFLVKQSSCCGREVADCSTLIALWLSLFCVSSSCVVSKSVVCECESSWSYLLSFLGLQTSVPGHTHLLVLALQTSKSDR